MDGLTSQGRQEVIPNLAEFGIRSQCFKDDVDRFFVVGSLTDTSLVAARPGVAPSARLGRFHGVRVRAHPAWK
jgi:hypothetical protein